MTLDKIFRLESNGFYREALRCLREFRQDGSTPLSLVHALRPYEARLRWLSVFYRSSEAADKMEAVEA